MMQIAWFDIMVRRLSAGISWTNNYIYNLSYCSDACIYITHFWVFFVRLGTAVYYGLKKGISPNSYFQRPLANTASKVKPLQAGFNPGQAKDFCLVIVVKVSSVGTLCME